MATLTVYDTKGNRYADGTTTGETDESIKDYFYGGVRFAIDVHRGVELIVFFRAKESKNARSEQFYARFETQSDSEFLAELLEALEETIEAGWGYTIDDSSDEMNLYQVLRGGEYEVPGTNLDHEIISELLDRGNRPRLGVEDEFSAVGLVNQFITEYSTAAITDSAESSSISTFDFVVVPGKGRGIQPLGETVDSWEDAQERVQASSVVDAINAVRSGANQLTRQEGLTGEEVRKLVTAEVPTLRSARRQTVETAPSLTNQSPQARRAIEDIQEAVTQLSDGHGLTAAEIRQKIHQQVPVLKPPNTSAGTGTAVSGTQNSGTSTSQSNSYGTSSSSPTSSSTTESLSDIGSSNGVLPDDKTTLLAVAMLVVGLAIVGGSVYVLLQMG